MTYPDRVIMEQGLLSKLAVIFCGFPAEQKLGNARVLFLRGMTLYTAITVLLLLLTAPVSAATPGLITANALLEKGFYADAVKILRVEAEKAPADPLIAFSLGKALNRSGERAEAEAFLKSALMTMPDDPTLNLELGILYFNRKVPAEALDYFEHVAELAPLGALGAEARMYRKKIAELSKPKPWMLKLTAGAQYDSNVMLNGSNQPLPQGISRESDWSAVINLGGSYRFLKTNRFEAAAGYSLYQNFHDRLSDFDVTQNLLDLSGTYFISSELKINVAYTYEYLLLGNNLYDDANSVAAMLSNSSSRWGYSSLEYRFRATDYRNSALYTDNNLRNGVNNTLTVTHLLPFDSLGSVWGSYALESDSTRRDYWDYIGNRFLLGVQADLPLKLTAAVTGEVYWKQYSADDPTYNTTRNDTQYSFGASLTSRLSERYSVTLAGLYIRNDSNIAQYDYSRSLTSLMFNVRL